MRPSRARTTIFRVQSVQATRRLTLRPFTAADADDLLALDADPQVMRFVDSKTKSLTQIQSEVLPRFLACYDRYPGFGFWAAHARGDGRFIGWFGLRPVTPAAAAMVDWPDPLPGNDHGDVEYRLDRNEWASA